MASLRQRLFCQHATRHGLVVISCIAIFIVPSWVNGKSDERYFHRPGLWINKDRPPSASEVESVLKGLRFFTGFMELRFEENGQLNLGDRKNVTRGSNTARELLVATVESQDAFVLESSKHSPLIAFAEIEPTGVYIDAIKVRHDVWHVRLDFGDFSQLRGHEKALASFNPAMALLHELAHGVLKKHDRLTKEDPLGECERHMNVIRKELGLAVRESYELRSWSGVTPGRVAETLQAEFRFSTFDESRNKAKILYLAFDMDRVCDSRKIASLPPGRAEIFVAIR